MNIETKNKMNSFIKKNKLELTVKGSALNSVYCIIAGYALYLGIEKGSELLDEDEFINVFNYAKNNNYGEWWKNEENRKQYKF